METSTGNKNRTILIVVVIVVLVVVAIGAVIAFGGHAGAPTQAQQATTTGATSTTTPYTSTSDTFAVNFSGTPAVTNTTFDSPTAGTIPMTEYRESVTGDTTGAYEFVFTYHYPPSYAFPADYLTGALTEFASSVKSKYPGATITSQTDTQLLGAPALSAVIRIPRAADTDLVITTKGQNSYIIGGYGLSQSDYNAFVGSFTFTQ